MIRRRYELRLVNPLPARVFDHLNGSAGQGPAPAVLVTERIDQTDLASLLGRISDFGFEVRGFRRLPEPVGSRPVRHPSPTCP